MRVLVLGGTGVFGSRLCRLLAADPGIALTIAARDHGAVDALARELGVEGRAFHWRRDLDRVLGEARVARRTMTWHRIARRNRPWRSLRP